MELETQFPSLELSKKLFELGVKQKSFFVWEFYDDNCYAVRFIPYAIPRNNCHGIKIYSAFSVAELLELLPSRITIKENEPFNSFRFRMEKSFIVVGENPSTIETTYIVNYHCDSTECSGENAWMSRTLTNNIWDIKAADALARILIFLIENGYVKNE